MSELDDWQPPAQPKRKGPPMWMVLTGCGCIIPGFLVVALLAWGMQHFGQATSPLAAYEALERTLPFDEALKGRPTGQADDPGTRQLESHEDPEFRLEYGIDIPFTGGMSLFLFTRGATIVDRKPVFAQDGIAATITKVPTKQGDDALAAKGAGRPYELTVQGRTLRGYRFDRMQSQVIVKFPRGTAEIEGPGVALRLLADVAQDPDDPKSKVFDVLLMMQRGRPEDPPLSDEDVLHFLAPFHIGPDR